MTKCNQLRPSEVNTYVVDVLIQRSKSSTTTSPRIKGIFLASDPMVRVVRISVYRGVFLRFVVIKWCERYYIVGLRLLLVFLLTPTAPSFRTF